MCTYDEKTKKLIKRFCEKVGLNYKSVKFVFNAKSLSLKLTVAESGITNMSRIFVIITEGDKGLMDKKDDSDSDNDNNNEEDTFRILFKEINGNRIIISVNPEHSMGDALKKYLNRKEKAESGNINSLIFIYHDKKIDNNSIKVKDFFGFLDSEIPIINIVDSSKLVGA